MAIDESLSADEGFESSSEAAGGPQCQQGHPPGAGRRQFSCHLCHDALSDVLERARCGHSFHASCLSYWCRRSPHCPICMRRVTAPRLRRRAPVMPRHVRTCINDRLMRQVWYILRLMTEQHERQVESLSTRVAELKATKKNHGDND